MIVGIGWNRPWIRYIFVRLNPGLFKKGQDSKDFIRDTDPDPFFRTAGERKSDPWNNQSDPQP